jgi:hypothetical protein
MSEYKSNSLYISKTSTEACFLDNVSKSGFQGLR